MKILNRVFRQIVRLLGLVGLLFLGLAVLLIRFPVIDGPAQQAWIQRWSVWVSRTIGLKMTVQGQIDPLINSALIVANHSSWLDIVVINSIQPAAFIAKAEIEKWPVVGLLVARSGTLFIERGKRHAVHQVLQDAVDRLKQQRFVAVFPEGTTNDGRGLLPFHGNMMEAAIRAGVPVQPIAIAYRNSNGALAESVAFVGQTTFVGSMLRVLADNELHVEISVLPLQQSVGSNRHELAKLSRIAVSKALQFVDEPNDQ